MFRKKMIAALLGLALLNVLSGLGIIFFKDVTLVPVLHWIRSLTEAQLENYAAAWGKLLMAIGLFLGFLATFVNLFGRKKRVQNSKR
jgi:hypothetical protein